MSARAVMAWRPEVPGWGLNRPPAWQDEALCQYTDPEIFFPEVGHSPAAAKRICAGCPVRAGCLEFALEHGIRHGVFGGLSEAQRRPLLADREPAVVALCPAGLHPRTPENARADGRCGLCAVTRERRKRAEDRAARTGDPTPRCGKKRAA